MKQRDANRVAVTLSLKTKHWDEDFITQNSIAPDSWVTAIVLKISIHINDFIFYGTLIV